jgi:hypothetical protein
MSGQNELMVGRMDKVLKGPTLWKLPLTLKPGPNEANIRLQVECSFNLSLLPFQVKEQQAYYCFHGCLL